MKKLERVKPANEPLFDEQKKAYFRDLIEKMKKRLDKKK